MRGINNNAPPFAAPAPPELYASFYRRDRRRDIVLLNNKDGFDF